MAESRLIAILVDGDNAQPSTIGYVLAETSKYGVITTRRIYGDWTTPNMSGWKDALHTYAIQPIQQFRYTVGKNATDSALIIDAMDLLHAGTIQGVCIVSSDSDYTRLATRIREQGLFVMGVGRSVTPKAFVNACNLFVYTENLLPQTTETGRETKTDSLTKVITQAVDEYRTAPLILPDWTEIVTQAVELTAQDDGWAFLSAVGISTRQLNPAFDPRSYGKDKLLPLLRSRSDLFEVIESRPSGEAVHYVRLIPRKGSSAE